MIRNTWTTLSLALSGGACGTHSKTSSCFSFIWNQGNKTPKCDFAMKGGAPSRLEPQDRSSEDGFSTHFEQNGRIIHLVWNKIFLFQPDDSTAANTWCCWNDIAASRCVVFICKLAQAHSSLPLAGYLQQKDEYSNSSQHKSSWIFKWVICKSTYSVKKKKVNDTWRYWRSRRW